MGPAGPVDTLTTVDPATGRRTVLPQRLRVRRAGHTATTLANGRVLIIGGIDSRGRLVSAQEIFDPATNTSTSAAGSVVPRAGHSATLLSDGRVLVAGGRVEGGVPTGLAEIWDPSTGTADQIPAGSLPRTRHRATMRGDGAVLLEGGVGLDGSAVAPELFFPETGAFVSAESLGSIPDVPTLAGSDPVDGAVDVPLLRTIVLRFTGPLAVHGPAGRAFSLSGPGGEVPADVVLAEGGRLFFVRPRQALEAGATYSLTIVSGVGGLASPTAAVVSFTTQRDDSNTRSRDVDDEIWTPDPLGGPWESGRAPSSWQHLAPLQAPPGVTALAGQILKLNGRPLADVDVRLAGARATTDRSGRFLLTHLPAGRQELVVDARPASQSGRTYGFFMIAVDVEDGRTTPLPFAIWMPALDTAHAIRLTTGLARDFVASTPRIPGLEVHIPAGGVLRDADGNLVRSMTITPIPIDRPPFPLPTGVRFPVYFTLQPGGARLEGTPSALARGIRLVFPNAARVRAGRRIDFWSYDSKGVGWFRYGQGTVARDGRTVVPDAGVVIRHFTCASIGDPSQAPGTGPTGTPDGDPVDLASGLFVYEKADLVLPDVIPIVLTRTYRQNDPISRPFGIGATHGFELFLVGDQAAYTYAELILPDGARVRYDRTSSGTGYLDAVMEATSTPTPFIHSVLSWNAGHGGWDLRLKDGTVYEFFVDFFPEFVLLKAVQDRYGNRLVITRDATRRITRIRSPHGRTLDVTYDTSHRITQVQDTIGRTASYEYDASGRLWKATDVRGGVTEYTYDASHRMLTITDPRAIVYLENEYDANGRVQRQTQADGGEYAFAYTLDVNNRVVQTDVTNPRGSVRRVTFNADGYPLTDTSALGELEAQTTTYLRHSPSNRITSVTDALGRETTFGYDSLGNLTSATRLAGTPDAVTTTLTYEAAFNQVATVTDPLNHTTAYAHDSRVPVIRHRRDGRRRERPA